MAAQPGALLFALLSATGTLVVSSPGSTPTAVDSFEISGTTVTSSDSANLGGSYSPQYGLDVLPGGSQFVLDGGVYQTTDIAAGAEIAYNTPGFGDTAAVVAPNGRLAIASGSGGYTEGPSVYVFPPGSMTAPSSTTGYAWMPETPAPRTAPKYNCGPAPVAATRSGTPRTGGSTTTTPQR